MQQRFDLTVVAADGYKAMLSVHAYVQKSGLNLGLLELVKVRVSQINGCAFCLAMHIPLARQNGVSDDQLNLLVAWREAPVFNKQERAALAWAESMTYLIDGDVPDHIYEQARDQFFPEGDRRSFVCRRGNQCMEPSDGLLADASANRSLTSAFLRVVM